MLCIFVTACNKNMYERSWKTISQDEYEAQYNAVLEAMLRNDYQEALHIAEILLVSPIEMSSKEFHVLEGILEEIHDNVKTTSYAWEDFDSQFSDVWLNRDSYVKIVRE